MLASLAAAALAPVLLAASAPTIRQIVDREKPAIVAIYAADGGGNVAQGTGFIVRSNGVILTNFHVIRGAQQAIVKLRTGEVYDRVWVLDYDAFRDLAVLKIQATRLPTVQLGPSEDVDVGDVVIAIGNPKGMEHTVSDGIVSAKRVVEGTEYIQMTAAISPGSSGGPLYSARGKVIGITTLTRADAQMMNFAVPLKYALPMLDASEAEKKTVAQVTAETGTRQRPEQREVADEERGNTVSDPSGTFLVTLPAGWRAMPPNENAVMAFESETESANLFVFRIPRDGNVAELFDAILGNLRSLGTFAPVGNAFESENMKVRWHSLTRGDTTVRALLAVVRTDRGSLYFFGMADPDKKQDQDAIVNILGSLKWRRPGA